MTKKVDSNKLFVKYAAETAALEEKIAQTNARAARDLEKQVDWSKKILDVQRDYNDALDASKQAQKVIRDLGAEINEYIELARLYHGKLTKEERKEAGFLVNNLKIQRDRVKEFNKEFIKQQQIAKIENQALPHRQKLVEYQKKLNKLEDKYKGSVEDTFDFIGDINDKIKEIPIVGGFLSKAIGLDDFQKKLTEKFTSKLTESFDKNSVNQKKAAEEAIRGYDAQIDRLNGVESAAGGVTDVVGDIGPAAMEGAEGAAAIEGGLMSAIPAAGGLMATLGPILPILIAIAAAAYLVKMALDIDKEISETAKSMGQTKHEALEAHEQFASIAADTQIIGANIEALTEANKELNAVLGTNVTASKRMLEAQVLLTKQYGLTGEEAADFQVTSASTGKTVEQNLATVEAMVEGYNTMTGDSLNFKEITKDIAKTSKATLASYHGDVKALTLAAIQAKKLGMSLEDTQAVADKLLDIEFSIENEMKANVLTGKHMNLNAARQLALQGDTAEAAAEVVSQAGGYDELMKMAPYQQKAIAEAAGQTVDQLMKAAELQEYSQALNGKEITDIKDLSAADIERLKTLGEIDKTKAEELTKNRQIASSQEKMAALGDKLMAVFAKLAGPIVEILDPLMEIVDFILPAIGPLIKFSFAPLLVLGDTVSGIVKLFKGDFTGALKDLGGSVMAVLGPITEIFDLIMSIFPGVKTVSSNMLLKQLVDFTGVNTAKSKEAGVKKTEVSDAVINPSGGLVVSGQKGTYQLDNNDTVIAGTSLGSLSSNARTSNSVNANNNNQNPEVVSLLKQLIAKVDQPVRINISGKVIDEIEKQTTLAKTYNTTVDKKYNTR